MRSVLNVFIFVAAQTYYKPEVRREQVHIYRVVDKVNVDVYSCRFSDSQITYSDISENCIEAFKSGIYTDKWGNNNRVQQRNSRVVLKQYKTEADLVANQIKLRSGTYCRYDRGFCYDPKESTHYAALWDVMEQKQEQLRAENLEEIFFGYLDIWSFKKKNLKYVVYTNNESDKSFSLQLGNKVKYQSGSFWYTADKKFIVSQTRLVPTKKVIPILDEPVLPLRSKRLVSQSIMNNYYLQTYPFDFENKIDDTFLSDSTHLKTILNAFQNKLLEFERLNCSTRLETIEKYFINLRVALASNDEKMTRINNDIKYIISNYSAQFKELQNNLNFNQQGNDEKYSNLTRSYNKLNQANNKIVSNFAEKYKELSTIYQLINNFNATLKNYGTNLFNEKYFTDNLLKFWKNYMREHGDNITLILGSYDSNIRAHNTELEKKILIKYAEIMNKLKQHDSGIEKCESCNGVLLNNTLYKLKKEVEFNLNRSIERENDYKNNLLQCQNSIGELQQKILKNEQTINGINLSVDANKKDTADINTDLSKTKILFSTINNELKDLKKDLQSLPEKEKEYKIINETLTDFYTKVLKAEKFSKNADKEISKIIGQVDNLQNILNTFKNNTPKEISTDTLVKLEIKWKNLLNQQGDNMALILGKFDSEWRKNYSQIDNQMRTSYGPLLLKLKQHDVAIGKCENCNGDLLKNYIEQLKLRVESNHNSIKQVQLGYTNSNAQLGSVVTELRTFVEKKGDETFSQLETYNKAIGDLKIQCGDCKISTANLPEQNRPEELEDIRRNLSIAQLALTEKDGEILKLKASLIDIQKVLDAMDEKISRTNKNCMNYVNIRLKSKDEEISQIHTLLLGKDDDIKNVQSKLSKRITECEDNTKKQIKVKDDEIKQIVSTHNRDIEKLHGDQDDLRKIIKAIEEGTALPPSN